MEMEGDTSDEPRRVLIVDAYSHSREGLRSALRGEACVVETAASSLEAITRIKDGRFELAIIDLELPPAHGVRMNGWELARVFRAFHPGAPVVLVTADWQPELKAQAQRLQGAHLMEKPINTTELRGLVRTLRGTPAPGSWGNENAERSGRR